MTAFAPRQSVRTLHVRPAARTRRHGRGLGGHARGTGRLPEGRRPQAARVGASAVQSRRRGPRRHQPEAAARLARPGGSARSAGAPTRTWSRPTISAWSTDAGTSRSSSSAGTQSGSSRASPGSPRRRCWESGASRRARAHPRARGRGAQGRARPPRREAVEPAPRPVRAGEDRRPRDRPAPRRVVQSVRDAGLHAARAARRPGGRPGNSTPSASQSTRWSPGSSRSDGIRRPRSSIRASPLRSSPRCPASGQSWRGASPPTRTPAGRTRSSSAEHSKGSAPDARRRRLGRLGAQGRCSARCPRRPWPRAIAAPTRWSAPPRPALRRSRTARSRGPGTGSSDGTPSSAR